jgi:hypothetical protein
MKPDDRFDIAREFVGAELGDERRRTRLLSLAHAAARRSNVTFPKMVGSEAALEGTYRFLSNPGFDWREILEPHENRTAERAQQHGRVLVVHDTTQCEFEHADPRQVGYTPTGKAGFFVHLSMVVSADDRHEPLGAAAVQAVFRASRRKRKSRQEPARWTTKYGDRESLRWQRGIEQSEQRLQGTKERIHVADREADNYQLLTLLNERGARFVVRLCQDRKARETEGTGPEWSTVRQIALSAEACLEREVPLTRRRVTTLPRSRKAPRKARSARLRFAATRVIVRRPHYLGREVFKTIELNLVHVYEVDPPAGQEPVDWLLATTEPVDTAEQVAAVVDIYRARWLIEEFFKALKTGCLYEQRQLETRHALLNALALFLPVATQLLWLRNRARDVADAPATDVLTPNQIEALRLLYHKDLPVRLTCHAALLAVAELGGHWKSNGPPGWIILHRGLHDVRAFAAGLAAHHAKTTRRNEING